MPRLKSNATLRPDLGQTASEYAVEQSQMSFIGNRILPVFETPEKSAEYPVIVMAEMLKLQKTERAARSAYGRSDYVFDDGDYTCKERGWEEPVDDTEAAQYANYFDVEELAANRAVDVILRGGEKRIADTVMNTSTFATTAAGTKWDVAGSATIKTNVNTASEAMRDACGLRPNVLVVPYKAFLAAMITDEIKDYLKYTNPHLMEGLDVQRALLAKYLGLDEVLVGDAQYNAAKKGAASASLTEVWDKTKAGLYRVTRNPRDLKDPCVGRTFLWTGDSPDIVTVESYREDQTRSDIYRARQNVDEKIMMAAAGRIITGIL